MSRSAVPTMLTRVNLGCLLVLSWTLAVAGEPVRVGILAPGVGLPTGTAQTVTRALHDVGYRHGENIVLEYRYAEGKPERLPELAKELAALPVRVIVAVGVEAVVASKRATSSIPIVIATGEGDFVAMGLIASWDRPGGNVTGMNLPRGEAARKRVELFKQAIGSLSRLAVLVYSPNPASPQLLHEVEATAKERMIHVLPINVSKPEDLDAGFKEAQQSGAQAIMTLQAPFFFQQRQKLAELAAQSKLPLAGGEREFAEAGAVLQVSLDIPGCAAGAAVFVDRILKGAKASELPVERCRKMEVVFNLKASRALGLTIDPALTREARVIE